MAFHDVEVPSGFQYSSAAAVGFATTVQETGSGHEFRVARQAQGRHRFRLVKALQSDSEARAIKTFQLARRGTLHSFKLTDFADYTTAADWTSTPGVSDQILGTGDGSTTTFQLVKRYDVGGPDEYTRVLTLPYADSVVAAVNGVPTSSFTVNGQGQVTFAAAPTSGHTVTAGCQFYVPVRFVSDFLSLQADAFGVWSVQDFDCIEVLGEVEQPERWFAGGATDWGAVSQSVQLSLQDGMLQQFAPTTAVSVFLPIPTRMPGGPLVFTIANATGSAGTIQIRDDAGNAVGSTIAAGAVKQVGLLVSGSTATWVTF